MSRKPSCDLPGAWGTLVVPRQAQPGADGDSTPWSTEIQSLKVMRPGASLFGCTWDPCATAPGPCIPEGGPASWDAAGVIETNPALVGFRVGRCASTRDWSWAPHCCCAEDVGSNLVARISRERSWPAEFEPAELDGEGDEMEWTEAVEESECGAGE